ncbi:Spc97 / Spc98 family protein [Nitzschia inconspicua]|uniref:Spc97 / Spc98 family protein n=1 Tax=Nitzschia inconspicua TaxID=303405 RepID=A0A9K3Q1R3_9STRA|nr:Spc97 / Spc98 family protein [Nitzschia inconspicua]
MASKDSDAVHRLVASITGNNDSPDLVSLAKRVLASQIGNSNSEIDDKELASTWRRISRKAPNPKIAREEVRRMYRLYEQEVTDNPAVPPKMLVVLTKLMSKRIPTYSYDISSLSQTKQAVAMDSDKNATAKSTSSDLQIKYDTASEKTASMQRKISPMKQRLIAYNQQHSPRLQVSTQLRRPQQASPSKQRTLSSSQLSPKHEKDPSHPTPPKHPKNVPSQFQHQQSKSPHSATPTSPSPSVKSRRVALKYGLGSQQPQKAEVSKRTSPTYPSDNFEEKRRELQQEEDMLLRECLYSLQGIDGERIRYYYRDPRNSQLPDINTYEGIRVQSTALSQTMLYTGEVLDTRLGTGPLDALRICGEAGWLYSRIQSYIQEVQQDQSKGVVARAFAESLAEQLRDYHSLLTTYEARLPAFSLRQLMVELKGPTNRLKILAMLTDGLREYTGGKLLSALYRHSIHGNSVHTNIVHTLLNKASRPWYEILFLWTTQGVLSDPWKEFFVTENVEVEERFLWTHKYKINYDLVPIGILEEHLVLLAFKLGKGINFIRRSLMDGKWTMNLSLSISVRKSTLLDDDSIANGDEGNHARELGYRYVSTSDATSENESLRKTLNEALELVHGHILRTISEEHHLMHHLFALKQFLLLGQGDFYSALMEGLHQEFRNAGEPGVVSSIYKHTFLTIVEGALRSTNAKYLPQYTIDRLQVELLLRPGEEVGDILREGRNKNLNEQPEDCRTVYDIFLLDYQVPDPLVAVIPPVSIERYKSIFSLLFRLKKIEFMLNYTWRQSATLSHALQTSAQYTGVDALTSDGYGQATYLLRNISILRQSMMHFVVNLKSYLMFEVVEGGWQKLKNAMEETTTLDEAIVAHDTYLRSIVGKAMVLDEEHCGNDVQNRLANQVGLVLATTDEFCALQEIIFNESLRAADVAAEKRVEAESRINCGKWGFDSEQDILEQETFFGLADPAILEEVRRISESYNDHSLEFLRALDEKVNGGQNDWMEYDRNWNKVGTSDNSRIRQFYNDDLDPQRFLIAQLDHNHFYASQTVERPE